MTLPRAPLPVVQAETDCPILDLEPELPIRVLVCEEAPADEGGARHLARQLRQAHGEADIDDGLPVEEIIYTSFGTLGEDLPEGRFDIVYWVMGGLPTAGDNAHLSELEVVQTWRDFLLQAQTRTWVIDLQGAEEDSTNIHTWACAIAEGGGPPSVVLPAGWSTTNREHFLRVLQLGLINGNRLSVATWQALLENEGEHSPRLFLPRNGDSGLNLGRLLERHRNRIEKVDAEYRAFGRRLEADVPPEGSLGFDAWQEMSRKVPGVLGELETLAQRQAAVAQERTPRGLSDLHQDITRVEELSRQQEEKEQTLQAALMEPMKDPETRTELSLDEAQEELFPNSDITEEE